MATCYFVLADENGTPIGTEAGVPIQVGVYVCACGHLSPRVTSSRMGYVPELLRFGALIKGLSSRFDTELLLPETSVSQSKLRVDVSKVEC